MKMSNTFYIITLIFNMKKSLILISLGLLNFLHGIFHIIQFIQSMMLVAYTTESHHETDTILEKIIHHPALAILWAIIGFLTLAIGIKDFLHHRKCKHKH